MLVLRTKLRLDDNTCPFRILILDKSKRIEHISPIRMIPCTKKGLLLAAKEMYIIAMEINRILAVLFLDEPSNHAGPVLRPFYSTMCIQLPVRFFVFLGGIETTSAAARAFVRTFIITLMTCMMAELTLPIPFIFSRLAVHNTASIIQ